MKLSDLEIKDHLEIDAKVVGVYLGARELNAGERDCKSSGVWNYSAELVKYSRNHWWGYLENKIH